MIQLYILPLFEVQIFPTQVYPLAELSQVLQGMLSWSMGCNFQWTSSPVIFDHKTFDNQSIMLLKLFDQSISWDSYLAQTSLFPYRCTLKFNTYGPLTFLTRWTVISLYNFNSQIILHWYRTGVQGSVLIVVYNNCSGRPGFICLHRAQNKNILISVHYPPTATAD